MNNLFRIFDPRTSINLSMNWLALLGGRLLFNSLSKPRDFYVNWSRKNHLINNSLLKLGSEFGTPFASKIDPFVVPLMLALFISIRAINRFGLSAYTYTPTRSISITVSLAITVWLFIEISYFIKALQAFLIHLVPSGTPGALIPLMILIELVRNFIRPITLSVRLAANIVAGHLLIRLINGGDPLSLSASIIIIGGLLLFFLEVGVAFIQGYVFSTLRVMYLSELNHNIIL